MSWRPSNYPYLAPAARPSRAATDRRSSASFTDGMSNMQRELSRSSHVTESSRTPNSIHSNVGDSINSLNPSLPSYIRHDSDTYLWSRPQLQLEDPTIYSAADHSLLPAASPLPQTTLDTNDLLLDVEPRLSDPNALFEFVINRLQQEYSTQPNPEAYALHLARMHLGVDSIRGFFRPREPNTGNSQARPQAPNSVRHPNQQQYLCLLCESPSRISSRGSFKRHVNDRHYAKSMFLCMHCDYSNTRKDKLRNHLRIRHPNFGGQSPQELRDRELMLPEPTRCDLCTSYELPIHTAPFVSWDVWFEGIEMHCRIEDDDETKSIKGPDSPDQNNGDAGGASGPYNSSLQFPPGPNAGGSSFLHGNDWASGSTFSGWAYHSQTRPESRMPSRGMDEELHAQNADSSCSKWQKSHSPLFFDVDHSKCCCVVSTGQQPRIAQSQKHSKSTSEHSNERKDCQLTTMLSKDMSKLSLIDGHKEIMSRISTAQLCLPSQGKLNVVADSIPKTSFLLSNVIQELDITTLIFSINRLSLHLDEKALITTSENHVRVAVDPLLVGETTLHRIHHDCPTSHQILLRQLGRCNASLNAIQWELSASSPLSQATMMQKRRRKRLSSLWARLRAVSFVLALQKEVEEEEVPNVPPSIIEKQLGLRKMSHETISPFTVQAIRSVYHLAHKHLSTFQDFEFPTKTNSLKTCWPGFESSLGVCGVLQTLTAIISTPKPSLVESFDTTDLYGLLHRYITNVSTASF